MGWSSKQLLLPLIIGLSLAGFGGGILYFLYIKDDDDDIENKRETQLQTSRQQKSQVKVPRQFVPAVIGRGGSTIKNIQSSTNTNASFDDDNIECPYRTCTIQGTAEGVRLAEAMIENVISTQPIIETYEIMVPQKACAKIIGRGGASIQEIQNSSRAKVIVERGGYYDSAAERRVIIKGTAEQIAVALQSIEEKVREEKEERMRLEAIAASRGPRMKKLSPRHTANEESEVVEEPVIQHTSVKGSDGLMEVYVSAVATPSQFWIQVAGPGLLDLENLVSKMTEYYDKIENRELHVLKNVTVGQIIAAKFKYDARWYRAEVICMLKDNKYEVYFVDYGDNETVEGCDIAELRTDFLSLRLQAVECSLANVKPRSSDGEWSDEACDRFAELTWLAQWKMLTAKVKGYKERILCQGRSRREGSPIPCVDLYDSKENKEIDVGKELVNESYAQVDDVLSTTSSTASITKPSSRNNIESSSGSSSNEQTPNRMPPKDATVAPVIDLTNSTPQNQLRVKNPAMVEEIDLVTPVKDKTARFIDFEKENIATNDNVTSSSNGSTFNTSTKYQTPSKSNLYPAGFYDDEAEHADSEDSEGFALN